MLVILKVALFIWFKKISITGKNKIPTTGPAIFASNHPNMVLDPIIVAATCNRLDGHFWAAQSLFKGPLGTVLRSTGGIPVARKQDTGQATEQEREKALDNLFESSYQVLARREAMYIFPEGTSYTSPHLLPLKTGTARLAIGFAKKYRAANLIAPIVPLGLNYVAKDTFRSQVIVQYADPIFPTDEEIDHPDGATILTQRVEAALRSCTINVDTWDELELIDLAHQIYITHHSISITKDLELLHRFTASYQKIHNQPIASELKQKLINYRDLLKHYGMEDILFAQKFNLKLIVKTLITKSIKLLVLFILAFPGYLLHFPLHFLGKLVSQNHPYFEELCQRKFAVLVFCVPAWYTLLLSIIWLCFGKEWGMFSLIALPTFGYIHVLSFEAEYTTAHTLKSLFKLLSLLVTTPQSTLNIIYKLRKEIHQLLHELATTLYPKDRIIETIPLTDPKLQATNLHFKSFETSNT
uniref:Phospholipid/glycerol acyltransferase domain-containing protein n=1 Tax=Arcella intermedia TaxID=1963864 RepID=A0A6B2L3C5_9EUKA